MEQNPNSASRIYSIDSGGHGPCGAVLPGGDPALPGAGGGLFHPAGRGVPL